MVTPEEMFKFVKEINKEIEEEIEGLSVIQNLSLETDGKEVQLKLFGGVVWTIEEEEIETKKDVYLVLGERMTELKKFVDGLKKLSEEKNTEEV